MIELLVEGDFLGVAQDEPRVIQASICGPGLTQVQVLLTELDAGDMTVKAARHLEQKNASATGEIKNALGLINVREELFLPLLIAAPCGEVSNVVVGGPRSVEQGLDQTLSLISALFSSTLLGHDSPV